jgi:hypothetical protein
MYVLKDGYEKFVLSYGDQCYPLNAYREMLFPDFKEELKQQDQKRFLELCALKKTKNKLKLALICAEYNTWMY